MPNIVKVGCLVRKYPIIITWWGGGGFPGLYVITSSPSYDLVGYTASPVLHAQTSRLEFKKVMTLCLSHGRPACSVVCVCGWGLMSLCLKFVDF